jgi:putative endonuclease
VARRGWRVYLLRCADGTLYAGATNDLRRRLSRHAAGTGARYTRSRLPVTLVLEIPCRGRSTALRREAALKAMTRAEKLDLVARSRRRARLRHARARVTRPAPGPERRGRYRTTNHSTATKWQALPASTNRCHTACMYFTRVST